MNDSYFWQMSPLRRLIWLKKFAAGGGGGSSVLKTVSGALIHITDALAKPAKKLVATLEPIQSGSGDPAPDNVRPITGWLNCNIYCSNHNIYDKTMYGTTSNYNNNVNTSIGVANSSSIVTVSGTNPIVVRSTSTWRGAAFFSKPLKKGYTARLRYRIDGDSTSAIKRSVYLVDKNNIIKRVVSNASSVDQDVNHVYRYTISNIEEDNLFLVFCVETASANKAINVYDLGFYFDNDAAYSEYVLPLGTTYPITFPTEAGTVYGGTLTINEDGSGILVRKYTRVKISSLTLGIVNGVFRASSNYTGGNSGWCEVYKKTSSSPANAPDKSIRFASQAWDTNNRIFIKDSSYTTVADLKAAVGDYYIVYMLKTPVTYNLTAESIQLLLGENNIWTDTNSNLELTYYADGNVSESANP